MTHHRTFDPEEADFFYMPVYSSCMVHPVAGSAERPAFPILGGQRVMHGTFMLMESKAWVQQHYPYWNRTGGGGPGAGAGGDGGVLSGGKTLHVQQHACKSFLLPGRGLWWPCCTAAALPSTHQPH